ncbi:MAG: phosphodiester glycosidase family protein [Verrucomicrobiota bacterium]
MRLSLSTLLIAYFGLGLALSSWDDSSRQNSIRELRSKLAPTEDHKPLSWWTKVDPKHGYRAEIIRLDLHDPTYEIDLWVNPAYTNSSTLGDGRLEPATSTARVADFNLSVNATPFALPGKTPLKSETWRSYIPGSPVQLRGLTMPRGGPIYGEQVAPNFPILWQDINGEYWLTDKIPQRAQWMLNGFSWLVSDGKIDRKTEADLRKAARTAVGISKDKKWLYIVVVPQNNSNPRNLGASLPNLANLLIKIGAHNAANLDGGSSTTFVIKDGSSYECAIEPKRWLSRPIPVMLGIRER